MKRTLTAALVVLSALVSSCASHARVAPPVNVVVTAQPGVDPAEATRLRTIVADNVRRWVTDGQPLTVSIDLAPETSETNASLYLHPSRMVQQVITANYKITDAEGFVLDWGTSRYLVTDVGYSRLDAMHRTANMIASRLTMLHPRG
jgi:hypothetical protein